MVLSACVSEDDRKKTREEPQRLGEGRRFVGLWRNLHHLGPKPSVDFHDFQDLKLTTVINARKDNSSDLS